MSHVTHTDESFPAYGQVMSHTWMRHVTQTWKSRITHIDEACHTYR